MRFFDASALVKRYVKEGGSDRVLAWLAERRAAAARFSEAEIASALVRRCREGAFAIAQRDRALARLRQDFRSLVLVETTAAVVERAVSLLVRHPLRAADALQLASGLELRDGLDRPIDFVAFDECLLAAARGEGFPVPS